MSQDLHPVNLENLADWLDGRLTEGEAARVTAHLAADCPQCEVDLAWLHRVKAAGRVPGLAEPPAELVARAKAIYDPALAPGSRRARQPRLVWSPRPVLALAAGFILVVGLVLGVLQRPTIRAQEAVVVAAPEPVEVRPVGQTSWQPAPDGDVLPEGMHLKVPTVGDAAVVRLFDGSSLTAGPGAELTLARLRSGLLSDSREIALQQEAGQVLYEVAALPDRQSTFRVQSPGAQVVVRGTRFIVAVDAALQTQVIVLEGRVEVYGATEERQLTAHEAAVVTAQGSVRPLPPLSPADGELDVTGSPREWLSNMLNAVITATPEPSPTIVQATPTPLPSPTTQTTPTPRPTPEPSKTPGGQPHKVKTPAYPWPTWPLTGTLPVPSREWTPQPWPTGGTPGPWPTDITPPHPWPTGLTPWPWPTGGTPPRPWPTWPRWTPPPIPTIRWTPHTWPTRFKSPVIPTAKPQSTRGQPTRRPTRRAFPTAVWTPGKIIAPPTPAITPHAPHQPTPKPPPIPPTPKVVMPTWPAPPPLPTGFLPPPGH